jgi:hypothetical protein
MCSNVQIPRALRAFGLPGIFFARDQSDALQLRGFDGAAAANPGQACRLSINP